MFKNESFFESCDIVAGFVPVDMQTADNEGDYVNIANVEKIIVVLFGAIGTAGQDPVFELKQATSRAGAGAKALNITKIMEKVGATALSAVGQWTAVTQAAAATYTNALSAEGEKLIAVEVTPDMLDIANGFTWLKGRIADVGGAAQLGCMFYIPIGRSYARNIPASLI